jgi:hypothetical protein
VIRTPPIFDDRVKFVISVLYVNLLRGNSRLCLFDFITDSLIRSLSTTMNRRDKLAYTDPFISSSNSWIRNAYSVMLSMSNEFCSPPDIRNVSDDRILPPTYRDRYLKVESTLDGDVVIIDPSFDDDNIGRSNSLYRSRTAPFREWQARSPQQDSKSRKESEERNPCSPGDQLQTSFHRRRHTRNLSSLLDATSIGRCGSLDSSDIFIGSEYLQATNDRKHKRDMSNGFIGQSIAHRRLNSIGSSHAIHSRPGHQREDSLGLDILSAAVEASQDELAQAAGEQLLPRRTILEPRSATRQINPSRSYPSQAQTYHATQNQSLPPPSVRHFVAPPHGPYVPVHSPYTHPNHGSYLNCVGPTYYASNYVPRQGYPLQQYPSQHSMHPPPPPAKGVMYPPMKRSQAHETYRDTNPSYKQKEIRSSHQDAPIFSDPEKDIKSEEVASAPIVKSHHRHMSSFSSVGLGNILSASIMSPVKEQESNTSTTTSNPHHRSTSSVSFLNGLDAVCGSADETFLRNLQEASNNAYKSPTPMDDPTENTQASIPAPSSSSTKLASGGTSKRVRRKCTVSGCINRVVQGGLCIAHGAKRKLCNHPGCPKNVKKAGMCSTHGPARKRCDIAGCGKVAVQGGRCIAHGAKKKICDVADCEKQAILAGMCKKHHDQMKSKGSSAQSDSGGGGGGSDSSVTSKRSSTMHKSNHTRGISIFLEIPATEIESIINSDSIRTDTSLVTSGHRVDARTGKSEGHW